MKNKEQLYNKLYQITHKINTTYNELITLSLKDLEDSSEYVNNCKLLRKYYFQEDKLTEGLSSEELEEIIEELECLDVNDDIIRMLDALISRLEWLMISNPDSEYNFDYDNEKDSLYELIDFETYKYSEYELSRVALLSYRKLIKRIEEGYLSESYEDIVSLKSYSRVFKYFFFGLSRYLEELGINYNFDIEKVPDLKELSLDFKPVYYIRILQIIERFSTNDKVMGIDELFENLFLRFYFDELLSRLDIESIIRLRESCEKDYIDEKRTLDSECLRKIKHREKELISGDK